MMHMWGGDRHAARIFSTPGWSPMVDMSSTSRRKVPIVVCDICLDGCRIFTAQIDPLQIASWTEPQAPVPMSLIRTISVWNWSGLSRTIESFRRVSDALFFPVSLGICIDVRDDGEAGDGAATSIGPIDTAVWSKPPREFCVMVSCTASL